MGESNCLDNRCGPDDTSLSLGCLSAENAALLENADLLSQVIQK